MGEQRRARKLWSLWGRRGPFIGRHEKEPLQKTYPGDSGLPRPETPALPETPGAFRDVSGQGNRAAPPFRQGNRLRGHSPSCEEETTRREFDLS